MNESVFRINLILLYVISHWWLEKLYILINFIIFDNRILNDLNLSLIQCHIICDMCQYLHIIFYQLFSWYNPLYIELLGIRNYYTILVTITLYRLSFIVIEIKFFSIWYTIIFYFIVIRLIGLKLIIMS